MVVVHFFDVGNEARAVTLCTSCVVFVFQCGVRWVSIVSCLVSCGCTCGLFLVMVAWTNGSDVRPSISPVLPLVFVFDV